MVFWEVSHALERDILTTSLHQKQQCFEEKPNSFLRVHVNNIIRHRNKSRILLTRKKNQGFIYSVICLKKLPVPQYFGEKSLG